MRDGAPMVRLLLIVAILQLAAILSGFPSHVAYSKSACGCTYPWTSRWTCFSGSCPIDGETGDSPFVRALIEQMKQPGVEIGFLFRRVRDNVLDMTNGTQEPYTYGSLPGREELYFKPPLN